MFSDLMAKCAQPASKAGRASRKDAQKIGLPTTDRHGNVEVETIAFKAVVFEGRLYAHLVISAPDGSTKEEIHLLQFGRPVLAGRLKPLPKAKGW